MVVDSLLEVHKESLDWPTAVLEVSNRVVLLDRDGVLNVDRTDSVKSLNDLEVLPGAAEATRALHDAGYRLLVVTNQAVVGRGLLSLDALHVINAELDHRLGDTIDGFYACPHTPEMGCSCRKPEPLLIETARVAWPFDPAETWFVVDADRDIDAARRAGVRPALVRTGKGAATEPRHPDVPAWDDLLAFTHWLLDQP
ncbi:MAG: D-glycero-alpha-D-manno-heptose-1,7-bisphosphate 7-phosphatase [Acidimicrobiia bacterium]